MAGGKGAGSKQVNHLPTLDYKKIKAGLEAGPEMLTTGKVGELRGVSAKEVRRKIENDELKAAKENGRWWIKREDVLDYLKVESKSNKWSTIGKKLFSIWKIIDQFVGVVAIFTLLVAVGQLLQAQQASQSTDNALATSNGNLSIQVVLLQTQNAIQENGIENEKEEYLATAIKSTLEALEEEERQSEATLIAGLPEPRDTSTLTSSPTSTPAPSATPTIASFITPYTSTPTATSGPTRPIVTPEPRPSETPVLPTATFIPATPIETPTSELKPTATRPPATSTA
ncbi:MAG TPA: helix-turn-helix domain-containing protein, partial [Anaerolineae bacterium]